MTFRRAANTLFAAIVLCTGTHAWAGLIIEPAAGSAGITGYSSMVADFIIYTASNPSQGVIPAPHNEWFSAPGGIAGSFDFDLGGTFTIDAVGLWNAGGNSASALRGFTLLAADNAAFNNATDLGSFDADPNTGPVTAAVPQVFSFTATSAAFVRIEIDSNSSGGQSGMGEPAFVSADSAESPEPASFALVGLAGLALAIHRRRSFR